MARPVQYVKEEFDLLRGDIASFNCSFGWKPEIREIYEKWCLIQPRILDILWRYEDIVVEPQDWTISEEETGESDSSRGSGSSDE
jgi:hypothetical protein